MSGRAQDRLLNARRLEAQGLAGQAESEYRAALAIAPRDLDALNGLGLILLAQGQAARAAPLLRRAAMVDPADARSQTNLGAVLERLGDSPGAAGAYGRALAVDPDCAAARRALAGLARAEGRLYEARRHYEALRRADPADVHALRALAGLAGLEGDAAAALAGFAEARALALAGGGGRPRRWTGAPLEGGRLLIEADAGLCETILLARFLSAARDRGARVILRGPAALQSLVAAAGGVWRTAPDSEPPPEADAWLPLGELPAVLGAARAFAPYLRARADLSAAWAWRLPRGERIRVGLVWSRDEDEAATGAPLETLLGALAWLDLDLIALQTGPAAAEAASSRRLRADLEVKDLEDLAAALTQVDLLVSVDAPALHLAGAMGVPAFALLGFIPRWIWMLGRADSPWYPSLTLFRQPRSGDWISAADALARAVRDLAHRRDPPR
jgi:tetratricopeptide (TPR) repeat protein